MINKSSDYNLNINYMGNLGNLLEEVNSFKYLQWESKNKKNL